MIQLQNRCHENKTIAQRYPMTASLFCVTNSTNEFPTDYITSVNIPKCRHVSFKIHCLEKGTQILMTNPAHIFVQTDALYNHNFLPLIPTAAKQKLANHKLNPGLFYFFYFFFYGLALQNVTSNLPI